MSDNLERQEIYWNGQLVGYAEAMRTGMAAMHGRWTPAETDAADDFLAEIAFLTDEAGSLTDEVWLGLGNVLPAFFLLSITTSEIRIVYSPNPTDGVVQ